MTIPSVFLAAVFLVSVSEGCLPSCDCGVTSKIETFWKGLYTQEMDNALEKAAKAGRQVLVYATDRPLSSKPLDCPLCVYGDVACNTITITIVPQGGCCDDPNLESVCYEVYESCGVVYSCDSTEVRYVLLDKNGVIAWIACDTCQGTSGCLEGGIAIDIDRWDDCCTQNTIAIARGLMTLLGVQFTHSFGSECFPC